MTVEELKQVVEKYQESCKEKSGSLVVFSETGPAGMKLIHALVRVVERQQREIDELKEKLN